MIYCIEERSRLTALLDSERSDECIDFTMMYHNYSRNNASISNFGGGFRWKSEYSWCIIEFSKKSRKTKKNYGKTGIFTQNQFSTDSIFLYAYNSKTNHCRNFHQMFIVDKLFLAQLKYLKILYKVPHILFLNSKFIKLFVFISNVKYSRLTNHLRSESFFVYNDTYHCIQISPTL
ncbi:hypothetical protein AGLY_011824 [Aphis glycines]|uniref:Uncharacterized protein n=1 Tax=Aphis glycines TaxID=307491 RepID=A0A6G0TC82_APHGL|nr:hypothetical protein AGLY_011824 [Aphis glycines]